MRFDLTYEQHLMLELIADGPMIAVPELESLAAPLLATRLITLAEDMKWKITQLGEAMLERTHFPLH